MADIIEVNFRKKKRIEKYTIIKNVCVVCFRGIIYDSRKQDNEEYIEVSKNNGQCVCKNCAIAIKELVDEHKWDK